MPIRYRVIVKKLCSGCEHQLDKSCKSCEFLKYNNVTNLLTFTTFLHDKHKNWIFFNVYEYVKGSSNSSKLHCFIKNKDEPNSKTL
jgi:hypothetical protein